MADAVFDGTELALLAFGQLMTLAAPSEAKEEPPLVWRLPLLPRPARATRRPRKRPLSLGRPRFPVDTRFSSPYTPFTAMSEGLQAQDRARAQRRSPRMSTYTLISSDSASPKNRRNFLR